MVCPKLVLTKHTNTAYTSHRYLPSILYRSLSQMGTGGRENKDIILLKRNLREKGLSATLHCVCNVCLELGCGPTYLVS